MEYSWHDHLTDQQVKDYADRKIKDAKVDYQMARHIVHCPECRKKVGVYLPKDEAKDK